MASKRGILTSTLLKVSRRSEFSSIFFAGMDLEGKGRRIYFAAESVLALSSIFAPTSVGFESSLSLFKVIALTSSISFDLLLENSVHKSLVCSARIF